MMSVKIYSSVIYGLRARTVTLKTDKEASPLLYERCQYVASVLRAQDFTIPEIPIQIEGIYSDIPLDTSLYDIPIAVALLASIDLIQSSSLKDYLIIGSLSQNGEVTPIHGALSIATQARKDQFKHIIVPLDNAREAAIINDVNVYGVQTLTDVVDILNGTSSIQPTFIDTRQEFLENQPTHAIDFADIKGYEKIKRGIEIAAAGGHSLLLEGTADIPKQALLEWIATILPPLTLQEAFTSTQIHSRAGVLPPHSTLLTKRPLRKVHHSWERQKVILNEQTGQPGEISLAHHGVLFLDELAEFNPKILEEIAHLIHTRRVVVTYQNNTIFYPAHSLMIASVSPCACGYYKHPTKHCTCSPHDIEQYFSKIPSTLLNHFDIQVGTQSDDSFSHQEPESSEVIATRILRAKDIQQKRFAEVKGISCNADMTDEAIQKYCSINQAEQLFLKAVMKKHGLIDGDYYKVLKVARTIADLGGSETIGIAHLVEASHKRIEYVLL